MNLDFFTEDWIIWAAALAVGVPLLMVIFTEIGSGLERRGSPAARPIKLLRNWVIPVAGFIGWLALAGLYNTENDWIKSLVTMMGMLILIFVLSALNVAIFRNAKRGTWREKLPSIFVAIVRLVLVIIGVGVMVSVVWGQDIGGLFAALGVTSIVMGLALQNAVGGVISGLLLLFEQPFKIGDFLDTGTVRGKVIEVNWRAVHLDTGIGTQIVPNAVLASSSFLNLSRPPGSYRLGLQLFFAITDPPDKVMEVLKRTAEALPMIVRDKPMDFEYAGSGVYQVGLRVETPFTLQAARHTYRTWLWYASIRAGLSFDYEPPDLAAQAVALQDAVVSIAPNLDLNDDACNVLLEEATLEVYGSGELVQGAGEVPSAMRFVIDGLIKDTVPVDDTSVDFGTVAAGDFIGLTAFTREPTFAESRAEGVTSLLAIPLATIDKLVKADPGIARQVGAAIQRKREFLREEIGKLRTHWELPHY
jgi:small-conductance mechanosensitive channel